MTDPIPWRHDDRDAAGTQTLTPPANEPAQPAGNSAGRPADACAAGVFLSRCPRAAGDLTSRCHAQRVARKTELQGESNDI